MERRVGGDRAGVKLVVRSLTYRWGDGEGASPSVEVLLVSQIVRALSEVAEQLKAGPELHILLAKSLREYSGEMRDEVRGVAAKLERGEPGAPVLDLDRMRTVAVHVYPLDAASLIVNEVRRARPARENPQRRAGDGWRAPEARREEVSGTLQRLCEAPNLPTLDGPQREELLRARGPSKRHSVSRSPNRRGRKAGRIPPRLRAGHANSREHPNDRRVAQRNNKIVRYPPLFDAKQPPTLPHDQKRSTPTLKPTTRRFPLSISPPVTSTPQTPPPPNHKLNQRRRSSSSTLTGASTGRTTLITSTQHPQPGIRTQINRTHHQKVRKKQVCENFQFFLAAS